MRKWVAGSILFQSVSVSVDGPNLQKLDLRCLLPKAFSRERLRKGHFVCQKQFGRDGRGRGETRVQQDFPTFRMWHATS